MPHAIEFAVRNLRGTVFGLALAACTMSPPSGGDVDMILTNARIYTVEEEQPWAQAVAIDDGRIVAVGAAAEVAMTRGTGTEVVDLGGRLVLPAFGDAHAHAVFGGSAYATCSLHSGDSIADYRRIISHCVADTPGTGVIYGVGWEDGLFPPKGIPNKEILDAISTERSLIFKSVGGHSLWLNSKALELAGITRATPDPPNGHIDRDPATGEPVGTLQETARALAAPLIPPPTDEEMQKAILYTVRHFNRLGITNWHDAGIEIDAGGKSRTLDAYAAVRGRGELTAHVGLALKWNNDRSLDQLPELLRLARRAEQLGLRADAVKFYLDGVIPQHTAAMLEPYANDPGVRGETQIADAIIEQAVAYLDAQDIQAHIHAIGDGAVRKALDAIEAARDQNGATDSRPMISHLNIIDPADQPRFGELDAIAVFQPLWAVWEPYMALTAEAVGARRMQYVYPVKSVLDGGGRVAYGADWPVASANPFLGIEVALRRIAPDQSDGRPLVAGEAVTLAQAIRSYTVDVAFANRLEHETGSIASGKSADLIVVDQDIFQIPAADIGKTKVLVTLFKGLEVFGTLDSIK